MTYSSFSRLAVLCLVSLAFAVAIGCKSQQNSLPREQSGLKRLALVYGRYIARHRGQPPASEADLKKYVQEMSPADLKAFGVEDANRIFISERDGKPYVIVCGQAKGPPGPGGAPVVAYEQEGKDGKRWVASYLGAVEEVDDARFRQMVPTAKP
jgi:hypothetical protein